ncbi:MAG: cobalamin biosynthesis protein CobD [Desulfobacterales bacterium]|nr:cobalamin biosynthesis protein CobD [Desulfobacterales bacterium]
MSLSIQLILALILDVIIGDPRWFPHPVRIIGKLCHWLEKIFWRPIHPVGQKLSGAAVFAIVTSVTGLVTWGSLTALDGLQTMVLTVAALLVLYLSIAGGDLVRHSKNVYQTLQSNDIYRARNAVALLVGRDTDTMDRTTISKACVESVSENLVDGITAPLFWAILFAFGAAVFSSPPMIGAATGAMMYKAINTMDSMFGYKNKRYIDFGYVPAVVDDLFNFLPARITGVCIISAAYLLGYDSRQAVRIFFQDRLKSTSPNSGHPESAVAGALGIQLGGPASYFGELIEKPVIGHGLRPPNAADILKCNRLVISSAFIFLLSSCVVIVLFLK